MKQVYPVGPHQLTSIFEIRVIHYREQKKVRALPILGAKRPKDDWRVIELSVIEEYEIPNEEFVVGPRP